jgi:4-hydroxy-tetrahydrodipicolinate reductase
MKLAIIGYGKMGKEIEKIARERNHEIVLIIDNDNPDDFTVGNLKSADVAVEFTQPETAFDNYLKCFEAKIPVVSGTTGWLSRFSDLEKKCTETDNTFFYASNFSLGVNLFFQLNRQLAKLMNPYQEYHVKITETHHTEKKDSPSGTAVSLAKDLIEIFEHKNGFVNSETENPELLPIISLRKVNIPGIHTITYESDVDILEITHSSKNRRGLALGAILAAEFVIGKKGIFSMKDLLKI